GGEIVFVCQEGHIAAFDQTLQEQESGLGPAARNYKIASQGSSWTHGQKTVLFMRVNFPDASGESISATDANELMRQANDFFVENSYGATSLRTTVTPLLTLPRLASSYGASAAYPDLLSDARQASAAAGYDTAN